MKIIFLLIGIVAAFVVFDACKFLYFFSQTKKLENISPKNLEFGQGASIRYIAAGDSTAVGVGASSIENTYTYKVAEYLGTNSKVEYTSIGVIGAKTEDVIGFQLEEIENYYPDMITISIGANDITNLVNEKTIYKNFQIIKERLEKNTKATIYITNIPYLGGAKLLPFWFRKFIDKKAVRINHALLNLESERFKVINIHDEIPRGAETFAADYFHPSDIGYKNWAKVFLNKI